MKNIKKLDKLLLIARTKCEYNKIATTNKPEIQIMIYRGFYNEICRNGWVEEYDDYTDFIKNLCNIGVAANT